ncbi:glucosamine-6-phosphate isomerase [Ramicandelaber brevisporus]|nr:glucosamine-6-phosphate isomerase [Ramicandelaber brevisporus]
MRLVIRHTAEQVADYLANYLKQRINDFNPTAERPFVLGLPTGSSPILVYRKLVDLYQRSELSFKHVICLGMDELVTLPQDHAASSAHYMRTYLFDHVDIDPNNINLLDGSADDLQAECLRYEEKIKELGGIELFLCGIGPDGHIAFNEPGSSLTSRTRVKTLAYETILANARFFGDGIESIQKVPKLALTVGVGTIMDAREVVVLITGTHKALALAKCIEEGVNHMWTVSAIQLHQRGLVVCDEDATLELHVKTVRYFRSIERVHEVLTAGGDYQIGLQGTVKSLAAVVSKPGQ